jgi:deazaflavin-dependent oxidoreductase (nitroreductase family)
VQLRDAVTDIAGKAMSGLHRVILKTSGGRLLGVVLGMPAVELHTIGRKSGIRRTTMLAAPIVEGDRVILVASKGGDHRDPDWYRNLVSHPEVEITREGVTRPMVARTASPEERAALWPRVVASYKGYAGYQRRTRRDIPVVICEPRA